MNALSVRENEIMSLVVDGLTNTAIGWRLGISYHTVKNHLYNVYRKLGIGTRSQASVAYIREERGVLFVAPVDPKPVAFNAFPWGRHASR